MLQKSQRIPRKLFSEISKNANLFSNEVFLFRFIKTKEKNSRFGFSISKKVAKKAVIRNKLRRCGYKIIKNYINSIPKGVLMTISFRKIPKNNTEIETNLENLLKKSKLIKN